MVKKGNTSYYLVLTEYHRACIEYLVNLHSIQATHKDIILWALDNMLEVEVIEPIQRKARYGHQLYKQESNILNMYADKQRINNLMVESDTV